MILVPALLYVILQHASAQLPSDSIRALLKREVAAQRGKSIIVGMIDSTGSRQVFAEGILSDKDRRQPDANTLYEIGSITKVFTALLLCDMDQQGQLSVNDPLSKYLPANTRAPQWNGKEITLLSLATHRSGMPRFPDNVFPKDPDFTRAYADYTPVKLYEYVSTFQPPDIDTKWRYSNVAYGLLGLILEKVSDKDYENLVKQRICQPLHMNNTVITLNAQQRSNLAIGHAETGAVVGLGQLGAIGAGGALLSNVNDLLTFARAQLGLVSTPLYPAMQQTHILQAKKEGEDTYTTMGWTLYQENGKHYLFKDGGMPGYRTYLGLDLVKKCAVVVLCNNNNSVTDIGRYLLDPSRRVDLYRYPWALLDTLRSTLRSSGVDATVARYRQLKAAADPRYTFNEATLNYLGEECRRNKQYKDAISLYALNAEEYPKSAGACESLATTYLLLKDKTKARQYFEKAQQLEPNNRHWRYMLEQISR